MKRNVLAMLILKKKLQEANTTFFKIIYEAKEAKILEVQSPNLRRLGSERNVGPKEAN